MLLKIMKSFAICLCPFLTSPAIVQAADPATQSTGSVGDWGLFKGADPDECWATTREIGATPNVAHIFVTANRKAPRILDPSFYFQQPIATVIAAQIGATSYSMVADDDWAWLAQKAETKKLLNDIIAGKELTIRVRYNSGEMKSHLFSLSGAKDAFQAVLRCAESNT